MGSLNGVASVLACGNCCISQCSKLFHNCCIFIFSGNRCFRKRPSKKHSHNTKWGQNAAALLQGQFGIPRTQALSAKATTAMRQHIAQQNRPWENAPTYLQAHEPPPTPARPTSVRKKAASSNP